jgi:hypothetical protein
MKRGAGGGTAWRASWCPKSRTATDNFPRLQLQARPRQPDLARRSTRQSRPLVGAGVDSARLVAIPQPREDLAVAAPCGLATALTLTICAMFRRQLWRRDAENFGYRFRCLAG